MNIPTTKPEFRAPTPGNVPGHHRVKAAAEALGTDAAADDTVFAADASAEKELANFKSANPDWHSKSGRVRLDELVVDPRIQRPPVIVEINKIAKEFDERALGTLTLSARPDGKGDYIYVILDGQQRRLGAIKAGFTGTVRAEVHYGLSLQEEARLFRLLNFRRAVQPIVLFKNALLEGDPDALTVQQILDDLGIPFGTPRGYSGAKASVRLVSRRNGATVLRWALTQVQRIYDPQGKGGCYDAAVVEAFYWLYDHHGSRIDEENLYNKLAREAGGVADLVGQAKLIKSVRGGRIGVNLIRAIIARYNHDKRSPRTKLPDWTLDSTGNESAEAAQVGAEVA